MSTETKSASKDAVLIPSITSILILDNEGKRIAAKFYAKDLKDAKTQTSLEKKLFAKTAKPTGRGEAEVLLLDKYVVVYKIVGDAYFYVLSNAEESELVVLGVLSALEETMNNLLRGMLGKKTLNDNLDLVLLAIDEICDDGIILETDATSVSSRVAMRGADKDVPLSEQTLQQAWTSAREQLARSLRS